MRKRRTMSEYKEVKRWEAVIIIDKGAEPQK
jgi:hypothetical protein